MEKRVMGIRDYLFMAAAVVIVVCMFLNWFPIELNLGVIQIDDALGNVNGFTFAGALKDLEEDLGVFASVLPEAYGQLKMWSVILLTLAVVTVSTCVASVTLRLLRKNKYENLLSIMTSGFAIATSCLFAKMVCGVYDYVGVTAYGINAMSVIAKGPCAIIVLSGFVAAVCTDLVAEAIGRIIDRVVVALANVVRGAAEWGKMIIQNIGYIISDAVGAIVGVFTGIWLENITDATLLAVVGGMIVAGIAAFTCMTFVWRVILHKEESLL